MAKKLAYSNLLIWVIFFSSVIFISPVFYNIGVSNTFLVLLQFVFLSVFLSVGGRSIDVKVLVLILSIVLTSFFSAIYWEGAFKIILLPSYFFVSLLLVSLLKKDEFIELTKLYTNFIIILLIGAYIAFFLAFIGIDPILQIYNADGRSNYLFYTSFTNVWFGFDVIRPSGIYDEPGALSFIVCFVALMRHISGLDNRKTWLILFLGLITFSVAHIIFLIFYMLSEKVNWKNINLIVSVLIFTTLIVFLVDIDWVIERIFLDRFVIDENSGRLAGDNRTAEMFYLLDIISMNNILWGLDSSCLINFPICSVKYNVAGVTPLSPLILKGVFISWPYYITIIAMLLIGSKKKRNLIFIGLALLFFQRPYILNFGYSYFALLPILFFMRK